jgi:hypothetical protein
MVVRDAKQFAGAVAIIRSRKRHGLTTCGGCAAGLTCAHCAAARDDETRKSDRRKRLIRKQLLSGAYKYQRWPRRDAMAKSSKVSTLGLPSDIYSRRDESGEREFIATPVCSSGYATPSAAFQSRSTPKLWHFPATDHKSISWSLLWATDQQHTH